MEFDFTEGTRILDGETDVSENGTEEDDDQEEMDYEEQYEDGADESSSDKQYYYNEIEQGNDESPLSSLVEAAAAAVPSAVESQPKAYDSAGGDGQKNLESQPDSARRDRQKIVEQYILGLNDDASEENCESPPRTTSLTTPETPPRPIPSQVPISISTSIDSDDDGIDEKWQQFISQQPPIHEWNRGEQTKKISPHGDFGDSSPNQTSTPNSCISNRTPAITVHEASEYDKPPSNQNQSSPLCGNTSDKSPNRKSDTAAKPDIFKPAPRSFPVPTTPIVVDNKTSSSSSLLFVNPTTDLSTAGRQAKEALETVEATDAPRLKKLALKVKVDLLKQQTKNLQCAFLIDQTFGVDEGLRHPSEYSLLLLRDTIAAELTAASFSRYANVVDLITAEKFRIENGTLETLQRDQIMSNPLFCDLFCCSGKAVNELAATGTNSGIPYEISSRSARNALLKQQLSEVVYTVGAKSPSERLSRRLSFLKGLHEFKITPMVTWSSLLNVISNLSAQIINTLYDDSSDECRNDIVQRSKLDSSHDISPFGSSIGAAGVKLFIGSVKDMLDKSIIRMSQKIGEIAIMFGVPVVMLPWNATFTSSPEYRDVLTRSLTRVAKDTAVPSMFLINQMLADRNDENGAIDEAESAATSSSLATDSDRRLAAQRVFHALTEGNQSGTVDLQIARGLVLKSLDNSNPIEANSTTPENRQSLTNTVESIIDDSMPVFENAIGVFISHLDKNITHLNAIVAKLVKKVILVTKLHRLKKTLETDDGDDKRKSLRSMLKTRVAAARGAKRNEEME